MSTSKGFIAVHAGAGYHATNKEKDYKAICKDACRQAMEILTKGGSALAAITRAVTVLEDSPLTNAGVGSNLTLDGKVECDASIMDGATLTFGAVGCITDVKNPVSVAHRLIETQLHGSLSLGRIPPSILVGSGARQWAKEQNLQLTKEAGLVTETSRRTYIKYKRKLERLSSDATSKSKTSTEDVKRQTREVDVTKQTPDESPQTSGSDDTRQTDVIKRQENPEECTGKSSNVQDTVGGVCVDWQGNMAAASSSGGIWLKQTGRLGPAAHYGAGCWAHNGSSEETPGVAVVTSGGGEHLIKTLLAKSCADCVQRAENATLGVSSAFRDHFLESEFLSHVDQKHGGVLVLKHHKDGGGREVEVVWAHTTDSMCVGYMLHSQPKPTTFVSRLPATSLPGKSFAMEGRNFSLEENDKDTSDQ